MKKVVRTAWSVWSWAEMLTLGALGLGPAAALAALERGDPTRPKTGRLFRDIGVVSTKLCPLWDLGVHGELPAKPPGRTVVVCNHCSQADPFLISHLPWEMKWLSKASIMKTPIVGWLMHLAGDVPVVRGDKGSAGAAMQRCRDYLERDMPVMIFPEGTRSTTKELLPFKDGAFRLAIETGSEVLPMALSGTRTALRKHDWKLGSCKALVTVGEPISTEGMTLDDMPALKERVRSAIVDLKKQLEPLTSA
jgi:1-acyl-sn-glycerol-3-phosphate acyltransferase